MIKIILVSCLVSYLVENFSDQEKFDLCPDSINCLCPKNITAPQIRVRCMDLSMVQEFCGPVSYPFRFFLFLLSESSNRCILMRQKKQIFLKNLITGPRRDSRRGCTCTRTGRCPSTKLLSRGERL